MGDGDNKCNWNINAPKFEPLYNNVSNHSESCLSNYESNLICQMASMMNNSNNTISGSNGGGEIYGAPHQIILGAHGQQHNTGISILWPTSTSTPNINPVHVHSHLTSAAKSGPADRSYRNSYCRHNNKVFDTGDAEIDKRLEILYKEVNPRTELGRSRNTYRYFVIKSYTEDHIHHSIKYGEWCSTQRGNENLDNAFRSNNGTNNIMLLFSVNGSGYFCGVAQMTSPYDRNRQTIAKWTSTNPNMVAGRNQGGFGTPGTASTAGSISTQGSTPASSSTSSSSTSSIYQGGFSVQWLYVKDVPNKYLRHITLDDPPRPITNCRDATEVLPSHRGYEALLIIHEYHHNSSLFDDFELYECMERNQRQHCEQDSDIANLR